MSDSSRRAFLRGGLRASIVTAGGLLLPMRGGNALAFPDVGAVPDIPVMTQPFAPSAELLECRRIVRAQAAVRGFHNGRAGGPGHPFYELAQEYAAVAGKVLDRPVCSWGQVVEIAEIAFRVADKQQETYWQGGVTGHLDGIDGHTAWRGREGWERSDFWLRPAPTLIEAVMAMGGGERLDANWFDGGVYG